MSDLDDIKTVTGDYYAWALSARKKYLLLLQQSDETIAEIYLAAIKRIIAEMKRGNKNLKILLEAIIGDVEQFNAELATAIKNSIDAGVTSGMFFNKMVTIEMLKRASIDITPMIKSFEFSRKRAIATSFARSHKDGLKLSERIWRISEHNKKIMSDIVRAGAGEDVVKVAKGLEAYVKYGRNNLSQNYPNMMKRMGSRIPLNLNYNALRLARTELTAAYGEGVVASAKVSPAVNNIKWVLSGTHPRVDICDSYAKGGKNGNGIYLASDCPPYPAHPNCICTLQPAPESTKKLVTRLKSWLDDPSTQPDLEKWYQEHYKIFE